MITAFLLTVLVIFLFRKQLKNCSIEYFRMLLLGVVLTFIPAYVGLSYSKWEILTALYQEEFQPTIKQLHTSQAIAGVEKIRQVKVMKYFNNEAEVFVEDDQSNKWLLTFTKNTQNEWTSKSEGVHQIDVISSKSAGTLDKWYWY